MLDRTSDPITGEQIAKALGISVRDYEEALAELIREGLVENVGSFEYRLTERGRNIELPPDDDSFNEGMKLGRALQAQRRRERFERFRNTKSAGG